MLISFERAVLGRTGLEAGRLGLSASYKMPTAAVEQAVEAGMNYLYWGSLRRDAFAQAIRNLASRRERLVIVLQCYSPLSGWIEWNVERGLRALSLDHADALLLGMWNRPVTPRVLDVGHKLKDRGLIRFLALSTHNRPLAPKLADSEIDIFHVRYNAVHTGAERDVFPRLAVDGRPGMAAFTATSWKQLLGHRRIPKNEPVPTAGDCYRFVLTNPNLDVCMTGLGSVEHWRHAHAALRKGPMSEDEMAWMRRVGDAIYGKPRR
jgi:aryl-alcohol dehydrogenase-like predicted oxidoreductase